MVWGKEKNICFKCLKFGAHWFVYDGRICSLQLLLAWTVCTPADGFLFQPFQCKYFRWQRQTPGFSQLLSVSMNAGLLEPLCGSVNIQQSSTCPNSM